MKEYIAQLLASLLLGVAIVFVIVLINEKDEKQKQEYVEIKQAEHEIQEVQEPMPEQVVLPELNYTYEELELLAHLIEAESGGDSELEMWYTGSVVLNRMKSGKYPDTLEAVIYQKGQYECTWNGHIDKEPSDIAYEVSAELLANGNIIPDYVLYQAEFEQGKGIYEKINNTYYCIGE